MHSPKASSSQGARTSSGTSRSHCAQLRASGATRWRPSCAALSPERARAAAAASGFVVATFVNEAQSDFGRNWLWHVDNVGQIALPIVLKDQKRRGANLEAHAALIRLPCCPADAPVE